MIRLYSTRHNGSFDMVTLGVQRALAHLKLYAGFLDLNQDEDSEDAEPGTGVDAPKALVIGNPFLTQLAHLRGIHDEVWLLLAPNSEGLPTNVKQLLSNDIYSYRQGKKAPIVRGLYSPSSWGVQVLQRELPRIESRLLRHGVLAEFQCDGALRDKVREDFTNGAFRAVHTSSTFYSRKGTKELIRAWAEVEAKVPAAELYVFCQPGMWTIYQEVAAKVGCKRVAFRKHFGADLVSWVRLLGHLHAVVQPSRGEGFGLVPLEARAVGVPVVATDCTGHSAHVVAGPGVVVVPTGPLGPIDDYAGAKAPTLEVGAIRDAILDLHANYLAHHDAARSQAVGVQREWAWERVTQEDLR